MGVFWKRTSKEGAMAGMITGIVFTAAYIIYFKFINPSANNATNWWFGISPEGIGTLGMLFNFVVTYVVTKMSPAPPEEIQELVESLRYPAEQK